MENQLMKMVRTNMLAIAAGVLISPALMAADIATNTETRDLSDEYLGTANATDEVFGGALVVELGAEYTVDDVITLTFSGDALDNTSLLPSIDVLEAGTFKGLTLGLLSSTSGEAVYRVTALTGASTDTTNGLLVTIADADDLIFNAQDVDAAGGVNVSFSAQTNNGLDLDTGGGDDRVVEYLDVSPQFSITADRAFNGVVDVNNDRLQFTDVGPLPDGINTDTLQATIVDDFADLDLDATFVSANYVVVGDFGWVVDDNTAPGIQPIAGVFDPSAGCGATDFVVEATQISWSCTTLGATLTIDVSKNLDANGDRVTLPKTPFTGTVDVLFDGFTNGASPEGTKPLLASGSLGAWVLNGFQAELSYTPYGSGIGQVIYLANRGAASGDVTVEYVDQDGNKGSLGVVATLPATSTLSLGPLIAAAMPQALLDFGRVAFTITANVPACDAQINAQYNAGGNRAYTSARDNCSIDGGSF
jgi:hypothetical protein